MVEVQKRGGWTSNRMRANGDTPPPADKVLETVIEAHRKGEATASMVHGLELTGLQPVSSFPVTVPGMGSETAIFSYEADQGIVLVTQMKASAGDGLMLLGATDEGSEPGLNELLCTFRVRSMNDLEHTVFCRMEYWAGPTYKVSFS